MSRKRGQREVSAVAKANRREIEEGGEVIDDSNSPKRKKKVVGAIPRTLKEKILAVVRGSDSLMSRQNIKSLLINDYGVTENKAFNTNVNKALKALIETNEETFGKVGGSYHSGVTSRAYLLHQEKEGANSALESHRRAGNILCPYCGHWCTHECFIEEDSVARGGHHQCQHCHKTFWSWISDGYLYGHKVEYRYGDGKPDYAGR
jgi:hypothetical protein